MAAAVTPAVPAEVVFTAVKEDAVPLAEWDGEPVGWLNTVWKPEFKAERKTGEDAVDDSLMLLEVLAASSAFELELELEAEPTVDDSTEEVVLGTSKTVPARTGPMPPFSGQSLVANGVKVACAAMLVIVVELAAAVLLVDAAVLKDDSGIA